MRRTKDISGDRRNSDVDRMTSKAEELYRKGDLENAMKCYGTAFKAGAKGRAPAMYVLLMGILEDPEEAIKISNEIISEDPDNGAAYASRASTLTIQNRYYEAISDYKVALQKEPSHKEMYAGIGYALSTLGRHEESVKAYRKSLAMLPGDAEAVYCMCRELEILGRYNEALDLLKKHKDRESKNRDVYMHMGRVYGKMGDWKQAYRNHVKAVWLSPPEAGESGYEDAMERYLRVMKISKVARSAEPDVDSLFWLAAQLLRINWDDNAINVFDTITCMKPNYKAYMVIGEIYERHGQLQWAIKYYERGLEFVDENESVVFEVAFTNLVRCAFHCGRFRDSLKYSRKAMDLGINNEEIDKYYSVILKNYGEDPEDLDQITAGWTTPEML